MQHWVIAQVVSLVLLAGLFGLAGISAAELAPAVAGPTVFTIPPENAERVPLNRADGICTLAEAVEAANDQGVSIPPLNDCGSGSAGLNVIQLQAGSYDLTALVAVINGGNTATFNIVTPIDVRGVTSDTTTIRRTDGATDEFRFFYVGSGGGLTLEDLTLSGGFANAGSGGGAVRVDGFGVVTLTSVSLLDNTARLGGALFNGGVTHIADSRFVGNSASENDEGLGGAIYATNRLDMTTSAVTGNSSTQHGGGIYVAGSGSGEVEIILSSINDNVANSDASGQGHGGGIYHAVGNLSLWTSTLANNAAVPILDDANGGGIYVADTLTTTFTLVTANAASNGAGMHLAETGSAVISRTLFLANIAAEAGGGIYNEGSVLMDNGVLWANVATQGNGGGLVIDNPDNNQTDLRNSTLYQNQAPAGSGGGIYNLSGGPAWTALSNVTVANNNAAGSGGGIASANDGQVVVASSTIVNNTSSGAGGGIASSDAVTEHVRLRNTIVANNTSPTGNCSGAMQSQGYNLDSGIGCPFSEPGDLTNINPNLASLAPADPLQVLSGNVTPAYDLLGGSPAIDAANPVACYDALNLNNNGMPLAKDQWGDPRVKYGRCDMGSIETDSPTAVTLVHLQADEAWTSIRAWPVALAGGLLLLVVLARRRAGLQ